MEQVSINNLYVFFDTGAKVNGEWKMMNYSSYYENVRLAAKGFIKVNIQNRYSYAV